MKKVRSYLFSFAVIYLITPYCFAQVKDSISPEPFTIWIDGGAGYSRDISLGVQATATPGGDYSKGGFTGLVRIRGSKNHFISIGVETGWQFISSVSQQTPQTTINATLSAIPVMGVVTLQDYNIELHGSVGIYRLISKASLFGTTVISSEWDMAFSLAASYELTIFGNYKILPEFRWLRINDQQKSFLSLMIRLQLPEWVPF